MSDIPFCRMDCYNGGMKIAQIPCLDSNYGYLIHDPVSLATAAIDTPDAEAILTTLAKRNWKLSDIFNTHHHGDHTGGNLRLKQETGCRIYGPAAESERIPGIDIQLEEGDIVRLGETNAHILEVPGHTKGHIAYHFESERVAFVGDTLFSMGCGRLFEGTAEQMWHSLSKIMSLPDDTLLYCAHEYTEVNGRFAMSVDPKNNNLRARMTEVMASRSKGIPTVPSRLDVEKRTNPFLRSGDAEIAVTLGMVGATEEQVFAELRRRKDCFSG